MKKIIIISISIVIIGSIGAYLKYRHDIQTECSNEVSRIERVGRLADMKLRLMKAGGNENVSADSLFKHYDKTTK